MEDLYVTQIVDLFVHGKTGQLIWKWKYSDGSWATQAWGPKGDYYKYF